MNHETNTLLDRLQAAKKQRGLLAKIAQESGVTYRTIYGIMNGSSPTLSTIEKLNACFKKIDRRAK